MTRIAPGDTAVLPTRRVTFEYPDDMHPMWVPHMPEFSAAANAISLGMPYAEPLFIRAMRSTFDRIAPELRARSESYIRQETGHHTQHKKFNDIVVAHYPAVRHVQKLMAINDRWVWRRSPRFRVAYAAAGETITYGDLARVLGAGAFSEIFDNGSGSAFYG